MNEELKKLAIESYNGACNVKALIDRLSEATKEMGQHEIRASDEVKVIVGQISFLIGESLGPSDDAMVRIETRYNLPPKI